MSQRSNNAAAGIAAYCQPCPHHGRPEKEGCSCQEAYPMQRIITRWTVLGPHGITAESRTKMAIAAKRYLEGSTLRLEQTV